MSITKRQQQIMDLLEANGFLTVTRLSELTYSSPSSIRRDLTLLQKISLVKRTHGGANLFNNDGNAVPFVNRMAQNIVGKKKIAKKTASLICDGQSIMLDGSSTVGFLLPYIAQHKNIQLFTNNMITAINAINCGIKTHCIGGSSVNNSAVLSGTQSYNEVLKLNPDILFFSSYGLDINGVISDPTEEENYLRSLMLSVCKKSVFLCDSEKFNRKSLYTLAELDHIDLAVFDTPWPELKTKCELICNI